MPTLFELINKKNSLPKGNVYRKKIKNGLYYYHQYSNEGKDITKKISDEAAILMIEQIKERKEIEKQINEILKNGNREIELSSYAKEYTGYVMSEDIIVAEFLKGELVSEPNPLCPLIIKRTNSLINFLKSRSIDSGRANSRLLRKVLNINVKDDTLVSLCSYAASISDNYWFKPKHSKLKYNDVAFNNDMFFDTALKGLVSIFPKKIILTPELTTTGSFEKGWKNDNGVWWLYKVGTSEEIYSEMFYSRLFEQLKLPTAHYEIDGKYIKTRNFSLSYNFEPMISIVGDNEDVNFIFDKLEEINHSIALEYLRLCVFDVVLNNVDRHNENCGLFRNRTTGEVISLAPNYDNNLSLISRNKTLTLDKTEGFLRAFVSQINNSKKLKSALKEIYFPVITEDILMSVHKQINIEIDVPFEQIKKFILFRYNTILEIINN